MTDRATHEQRVCDPDGYRPAFCPTWGARPLHVRDYRERILRAEPGAPVARVVCHVCVRCAGIRQILPAFLARHLWRTWSVVEHTLTGAKPADPPPAAGPRARWPPVPAHTQQRWQARWRRPAEVLGQILATCGEAAWAALAALLAPAATCADLIAAYADTQATPSGQHLATVAALIYRLQPKVRLL